MNVQVFGSFVLCFWVICAYFNAVIKAGFIKKKLNLTVH